MNAQDKYQRTMRELSYAYVGIILVLVYAIITQ